MRRCDYCLAEIADGDSHCCGCTFIPSEADALRSELAALTRKLAESERMRDAGTCHDMLIATIADCNAKDDELTQLRALRDRLVALKQRGVIPRDDFLAIIARAEELAK